MVDQIAQGPVGLGDRRLGLDPPVSMLGDEAQHPLGEIAEAVGEFGIGPVYNRFHRPAAILPETELAQQEVAQRIDAEAVGRLARIGDICLLYTSDAADE